MHMYTPRQLLEYPQVQKAFGLLQEREEEMTEQQIEFARIPSPDLRAEQRAERLLQHFGMASLHGIGKDEVGNVFGTYRGGDPKAPKLIISAHLDTVFPHLASIDIQRQGTVLRGPGIADDAAGLTAIVQLARVLGECDLRVERDIVVAGTIGEEGQGDLAGVRHLLQVTSPASATFAFATFDLGGQSTIVQAGLGSRRFRVTITGPGGHSWGDFGRANPVHAAARIVSAFVRSAGEMSGLPKNGSFNVGQIRGGEGVTAIPERAEFLVDLRGREAGLLDGLEAKLHAAIDAGLAAERQWSREGKLSHTLQCIGDRPMGETPRDAPVVRAFQQGLEALGYSVHLAISSTDANYPMSLGIPAVALPHGVRAYNAHSMDEWCDVRGRVSVLQGALLGILSLAGFLPRG